MDKKTFYKISRDVIYDLCENGYSASGIDMDNDGLLVLRFFKNLTIEEIIKHPGFVCTDEEVIINLKHKARERIKHYLEAKKKYLEECEEIKKRFGAHSNSEKVKREINKAQMGKPESFLEVLSLEEVRTTKSVPRRGFSSYSRIAKG